MNNEINTVPERLLKIRCCKSIITCRYQLILLCQIAQRFYIYTLNGWIGGSLYIDQPDGSIFFNSFFRFIQITQIYNNGGDAQWRQYFSNKFFCSSIQGEMSKNFITRLQRR